jgi:hypothetical protein
MEVGKPLLSFAVLAALAAGAGAEKGKSGPVVIGPAAAVAVDVDLRELPRVDTVPKGVVEVKARRRPELPGFQPRPERRPDPVVQRGTAKAAGLAAPSVSFDGIVTGALPPDTVGDVGPGHYVQAVNTSFAVFDKTGGLLAGPSPIRSLWSTTGGPCWTAPSSDPVVVHDPLADRWLITVVTTDGSHRLCAAVSQSADPVAGGFFLYEFALGVLPDYLKAGVWRDAYLMAANLQGPAGVWAFDRAGMLAGAAAVSVAFTAPAAGLHSMLMPADLDGSTPPGAGAPGVFYRHVDGDQFGGVDRLELFELSPDFGTPANSTFTGPTALAAAPFASLCGFSFDCVDQPGTAQRLDSITEWPMWRFAYRNFGVHESLVGAWAVDAGGGSAAAVRWFELRSSGGGWTIHQQGTYAPDPARRWMASAAMDRAGNLAVGYNVSSAAVFPSLRFAGRLAGDPPGVLTLGETVLAAGGGAQTGSNRWGDYSSLVVDPADGCTFWLTGEYYAGTSPFGWKTRVGAFSFPECPGEVFSDGFETGDASAWSSAVP